MFDYARSTLKGGGSPALVWNGRQIPQGSLLVLAEASSGAGDIIQFSRYFSTLKRMASVVVFSVPTRLHRLLRSIKCPPRLLPAETSACGFDEQVSMLSLQYFLGECQDVWPGGQGYLAAERKRVVYWQTRMPRDSRFRVAICWEGNPRHDRERDIPLRAFQPLLRNREIDFFSLQQSRARWQIQQLGWQGRIRDLGPRIDQDDAFVDSAAILQTVDLLITSDTGMAHLAGALGVPVWILLRRFPDIRWTKKGMISDLYRSARTFRQVEEGDWKSVMSVVALDLERVAVEGGGGLPPVRTSKVGYLV